MRQRVRSIVAASAVTALLAGPPAAAVDLSGAIFTTSVDGTWVNGNVYDGPQAVYLNAGPRANQSCSAAGLPDGDYYFQVTDPSGKELLSDRGPDNGTVTVMGGVITDYSGPPARTAEGRCNGLTVQLAPFGPTPSPGGEYKVWVTPVASYACSASSCGGSFGFFSSASKTDTFKVQPPGR